MDHGTHIITLEINFLRWGCRWTTVPAWSAWALSPEAWLDPCGPEINGGLAEELFWEWLSEMARKSEVQSFLKMFDP